MLFRFLGQLTICYNLPIDMYNDAGIQRKAAPRALPDSCELGVDGKVLIITRPQLQGEIGGLLGQAAAV